MGANLFNFTIEDNLSEFDETFNEYLKWQSRQPADIVNAKLYFVDLQWMRNIKFADKAQIALKLRNASTTYPSAPSAGILVNMERKAKGKKGLNGAKMTLAIENFIKKEQSKTMFLRSGCLPAVKILDLYNKRGDIQFVKRFAPKKPVGVKQYGRPKGTAIPAISNRPRVYGSITNLVGQGKQDTSTAQPIIIAGLRTGVNLEMISMRQYIERKHREQFDKMKRKG